MKTLLLLLLTTCSLIAQHSWVKGGRFHRGFIIPHADVIKEISYSKPWGIELDISKHLTSQKAWNECSCYPRIGLSMAYFNFANPAILGNAYWLMPYVEPTLRTHRKLYFSSRLGAGLVYLDNVYHPQHNPLNHFYSSPISFSLVGASGFNLKIHQNVLARLLMNYQHISNGGLKLPNKGINFPTISIGIDYTPQQDFSPKAYKDTFDIKKIFKQQIWLHTFGTFPHTIVEPKKRFPLIGVSLTYRNRLTHHSGLAIGTEGYANYALKKSLEQKNISKDFRKVGLFTGYDFVVGKFSIGAYLGTYLYSPIILFDKIYQRWQLNYQMKRWQVGIALKAHRHIADFLDARIGYAIGQFKN